MVACRMSGTSRLARSPSYFHRMRRRDDEKFEGRYGGRAGKKRPPLAPRKGVTGSFPHLRRASQTAMLLVTLMSGLDAAATPANECSDKDGIAAETLTDHLNSWQDMYSAYKQYKQCDDGGVADRTRAPVLAGALACRHRIRGPDDSVPQQDVSGILRAPSSVSNQSERPVKKA